MPRLMKGFRDILQDDIQDTHPVFSWPDPERIAIGIAAIVRTREALAACDQDPEGLQVLYATRQDPLSLRAGILRSGVVEDVGDATFGHVWLGARATGLTEAVATMAASRWDTWRRAAEQADEEARAILRPLLTKNLRTPEA